MKIYKGKTHLSSIHIVIEGMYDTKDVGPSRLIV